MLMIFYQATFLYANSFMKFVVNILLTVFYSTE